MNQIVDELAKDERIAQLYDLWYRDKQAAGMSTMSGPCNGYPSLKILTSSPSAMQWYGRRWSWTWSSDRRKTRTTPRPLLPMATRLLRQVGQIAHQFSLDTPITRLVDKKLRQKIAEKKLAHGQKNRDVIGGIPITKKQRYLAGRTDLVALLRSRGETLKKLGSEWEWKFHDERVTIRGHLWFDQYTQKGGDAVDFFHYFYGESEEQAAAMLLNCSVQDLEKLPARSPPVSSRPKQEEPKQLEIPSVNGQYAAGIRLPVPDQGHHPGGGVRLCPEGAPLRER